MSDLSTFDFGEHGVCRPDENGLYHDYFYDGLGNGIDEVEALRQWLVAHNRIDDYVDYLQKVDRLAELAGWVAKTNKITPWPEIQGLTKD